MEVKENFQIWNDTRIKYSFPDRKKADFDV